MNFQVLQDIETVFELSGLSGEEFAGKLGVSRSTLNNWLSGRQAVSEKHMRSFYEYAFQSGVRLNKIKEQLYREEITDPSEILLFHGAKTEIEGRLRLDYSRRRNDFGPGFYCGESFEQSAMFVSAFPNSSLYMMSFCKDDLRGRSFGVDRDWMLMIAYFRERLGRFAETELIQELICQNEGIDYIVAPIADNRMFEIIDQFIDGEITDVQCQHCLSATNLGKQYVFVSQKALDQIRILERCYLTDGEKQFYLTSRMGSFEMNQDKVKIARKQYRDQGNYIEDILK